MEGDEQAEAARRAKEAGNDAYRKSSLEAAAEHYTLGTRDITFLTNRAAAYFRVGKYEECVRDCDEAVNRGRELSSGSELIAKALFQKASALLELACCAADYTPAIRALKLSLAENYSEETLEKLNEAESVRKEVEEQERLDQEAANQYREKGNEFFRQKKYHEAAIHYTRATKMNPKDPRSSMPHPSGAFPQGLEDAEKCIELDPNFLKGYMRKAKVQFLMESYENALATYLEGLKCDPNNLEVLDGLRRCAACIKGSNAGDVELEDLKYVDIEELKYFSGDGPNTGHQQRSNGVSASRVVTSRCQCNTKDIDESSAERLYDAMSYAMANMMLIQVPVLGTTKEFWRLSDKATRISRKLALILRSHHSVGKYLAAPLQVSNIWIGSNGSVKLRGVSFTGKGFSIERVRDDYKRLSGILTALITISGGDSTKLPPDYTEFLLLLESDTLTMKDEFLIVNNAALLPIKNRTEVFLMLHDRIVDYLGCTNKKKKRRILSSLPYKEDWLDTAKANTKINQWVVNVQNEYRMTPPDLLRLNRNVRSHLHRYNDGDDIEEVLYCEWPELLMVMQKMLHLEGELEGTDIQNKYG